MSQRQVLFLLCLLGAAVYVPGSFVSAGSDDAGLLPLAGVPCPWADGDWPEAPWACAIIGDVIAKTAIQRTWDTLDKTVFLSLGQ